MPAKTKPERAGSVLSKTIAERTRIQPVNRRRNPTGVSKVGVREASAITVKIAQLPLFRACECFSLPAKYKILITEIRKMSFLSSGYTARIER
jgi:hypothetical protein